MVNSPIILSQPATRKAKINAGLPPRKTNTGFCGDPGVESAKSIFFGVDEGGVPTRSKANQTVNHRNWDRSANGRVSPHAIPAQIQPYRISPVGARPVSRK